MLTPIPVAFKLTRRRYSILRGPPSRPMPLILVSSAIYTRLSSIFPDKREHHIACGHAFDVCIDTVQRSGVTIRMLERRRGRLNVTLGALHLQVLEQRIDIAQ